MENHRTPGDSPTRSCPPLGNALTSKKLRQSSLPPNKVTQGCLVPVNRRGRNWINDSCQRKAGQKAESWQQGWVWGYQLCSRKDACQRTELLCDLVLHRWHSFCCFWKFNSGCADGIQWACNAWDNVLGGDPKDKLCHSQERWDMPDLLLLSCPVKGSSNLLAVWAKNFGFTFNCSFPHPIIQFYWIFKKMQTQSLFSISISTYYIRPS